MQQVAIENFCDWVRLDSIGVRRDAWAASVETAGPAIVESRFTKRRCHFRALEASNFLKRTPDDMYIRADIGC